MSSAKHNLIWGGLVVFLLSLGIRLHAVANTDVIQRDGVTFIRIARVFSESGLRPALDASHQHVGYPALVAWTHRLSGGKDGPESWERAGQAVSLAAGTLAMMGVWAFGGLVLDWQAAWVAAVIFSVGRKWVSLGADVMSDASALCAFIWALNFGILAIRSRGRWARGGWALAAGLLAGGGYWVRPEAGGAALIVVGTVAAGVLTKRLAARRGAAIICTTLIAAMALAGPYMRLVGGLTTKTHGQSVVRAGPGAGGGLPLAMVANAAGPASDRIAPYALFSQTVEALNPVVFGILVLWLVSLAAYLASPREARKTTMAFPGWAGRWMIGVTALLFVPVLLGLHARAGYLDWRHCMPLAFVFVPFAGAAFQAYMPWFAATLFRVPRMAPVLWALLLPSAVAGASYQTWAPLHGGQTYIREAAAYLRGHVAAGQSIAVNAMLIRHYSGLQGTYVDTSRHDMSQVQEMLEARTPRPAWVALSDRWIADGHVAPLPADRYDLAAVFSQKGSAEEADRIRIYRAKGAP